MYGRVNHLCVGFMCVNAKKQRHGLIWYSHRGNMEDNRGSKFYWKTISRKTSNKLWRCTRMGAVNCSTPADLSCEAPTVWKKKKNQNPNTKRSEVILRKQGAGWGWRQRGAGGGGHRVISLSWRSRGRPCRAWRPPAAAWSWRPWSGSWRCLASPSEPCCRRPPSRPGGPGADRCLQSVCEIQGGRSGGECTRTRARTHTTKSHPLMQCFFFSFHIGNTLCSHQIYEPNIWNNVAINKNVK